MKKAILGLSVIALLVTSCKKDNAETSTVTPTKENLTGNYMLADVQVKSGSTEIPFSNYPACEKDDLYKLNADLSYQIIDQGQTCDNDETSTWSLGANSTLTLSSMDYTIRRFDGKSLELVIDLGNGGSFIYYYTKQ